MLVWIQAARIKTLYASLSPVMVGVALAANQGSINVLVFICTLIAAVFIQVGTNLANDYYDYKNGVDNKNRLGPDRVTQKGLLQPNQVKNGMIFSFIIALIFGFYLSFVGGWPIVLIGIVSILSGVLYTGGSKPYGYIGLGDIFVFIFFGVIAVPGTYYLQTNLISIPSILCGLSCGALSTSLIVVNNLRDMDNDRESGKMTLAVKLGSRFACWEYAIMNAIAYIIILVLILIFDFGMGLYLVLLLMPLSYNLSRTIFSKRGSDLNQYIGLTARHSILHFTLLSLMLIIQ